MKRFRISQKDLIKVNVTYKGQLIIPSIMDSFNSIDSIKYFIKQKLPWEYKGLGRKIEIGIYNLTKEQAKYINTFS